MSKSKKKPPMPKQATVKTATHKEAEKTAKGVKFVKPEAPKITDAKKAIRSSSKQAMLITLLQRPAGATVGEMSKATGWQNHSVLGAISGVLRKRLKLTVESAVESRGRVYRIAGAR